MTLKPVAALVGALAAFAASGACAESAGAWTYTAELKDGGGGFVTALSPAPPASYNDPSYLIARCINGRAEFLVGGQGGWGLSGGRLEVTAQVDGAAARTGRWDVSSNGKAVFLAEDVEGFLRALPDPGRIRLSVKDPTGAVRENVFDISGFAVVRAKIAKACRWAQ